MNDYSRLPLYYYTLYQISWQLCQKNEAPAVKFILSAGADRYLADSITGIFTWYWEQLIHLRDAVPMDDDEYRLTIHSLGWAAYHFVREWILEDIRKSPEEISGLILRLMAPLT